MMPCKNMNSRTTRHYTSILVGNVGDMLQTCQKMSVLLVIFKKHVSVQQHDTFILLVVFQNLVKLTVTINYATSKPALQDQHVLKLPKNNLEFI